MASRYADARRGGLREFSNENTYDAMQVCLNGHVITDYYHDSPSGRRDHCPDCGAKTIYTCPSCGAEIKGHLRVSGVFRRPPELGPKYCDNCGEAFPWTAKAISAATELVDEAELSPEERDKAKADVEDIIKGSPRVEAAIKRLKRYSQKAGGWLWDELKSVLVDYASETTVKMMKTP